MLKDGLPKSEPPQDTTDTPSLCESPTIVSPSKSLFRFPNQKHGTYSSKCELLSPAGSPEQHPSSSSSSKTSPLYCPNTSRPLKHKEKKVSSNPEFLVKECWKATSKDLPVNFVELFKENNFDEDLEGQKNKWKQSLEDEKDDPALELSCTREFHALTEVQKARILTAVEDVIKKLANGSVKDYALGNQERCLENPSFVSATVNIEKFFCKKFLLLWVVMKVMEMLICHIIQLTFLSVDTYFQRKNEFLPVIVTYYFTLFIIMLSLVVHISCYSYAGINHPCYFMCVISSSILTLTTTLGILIMLCSMDYYKSFREILVLVFVGALLCSLIGELCIGYIEVKNFWNKVRHTDQYYLA